jgi:hypothetical protein
LPTPAIPSQALTRSVRCPPAADGRGSQQCVLRPRQKRPRARPCIYFENEPWASCCRHLTRDEALRTAELQNPQSGTRSCMWLVPRISKLQQLIHGPLSLSAARLIDLGAQMELWTVQGNLSPLAPRKPHQDRSAPLIHRPRRNGFRRLSPSLHAEHHDEPPRAPSGGPGRAFGGWPLIPPLGRPKPGWWRPHPHNPLFSRVPNNFGSPACGFNLAFLGG